MATGQYYFTARLPTANGVIVLFLQPFAHERIHLVCVRFEALEQFELSLCADQVVLRAVYLVVRVAVDVVGQETDCLHEVSKRPPYGRSLISKGVRKDLAFSM